jgi:hypothetical protein
MGDGEANQGRAIGHEVPILDCRWAQVNDAETKRRLLSRRRTHAVTSSGALADVELTTPGAKLAPTLVRLDGGRIDAE